MSTTIEATIEACCQNSAFMTFFRQPSRVLRSFLAPFGEAAQLCDGRLVGLLIKTACERVATFLLDMAKRLAEDTIDVRVSRQDIADCLGLTMEAVSRILTQFIEERVIEIAGSRQITLRSLPVLSELGKQSSSDNGFLDPFILPQSRIHPTAPLRAAGGSA